MWQTGAMIRVFITCLLAFVAAHAVCAAEGLAEGLTDEPAGRTPVTGA